MTAFLKIVEEGETSALADLLTKGTCNVDATNKRGDTALHIAARLGNLTALELLCAHGANLDISNCLGDTAAILCSRHGDLPALRILVEGGTDLTIRNKEGETCLHAACVFGDQTLISYICSQSSINLDQQDENGESALHIASSRGFLECVKCLVERGSTLDLPNAFCATPLHMALSAGQNSCAMYLMHAGADCDAQDWDGDAPIHIAARQGLLTAVQTLCAFGCNVDVANKEGFYPLHMAALYGHTEVVRCLCLAGCKIENKNGDGIKAEITALKHGFNDISDLLNRLRNSIHREQFINQLVPTLQPISRVNLKILGQSGVGKTTFFQSLQSGYFRSLFKRSKASTNNVFKGLSSSPPNSHIEMDVTSRSQSLSFDTYDYQYTHGINIKQVCLSSVGDLTVWDFSGQDTYFLVHHFFLGCSQSIYAIVVNLCDSQNIQLEQARFWLSFLQVRLKSSSIGYCGVVSSLVQIIIIGTHPDLARIPRDSNGDFLQSGAQQLAHSLQKQYKMYFHIHPDIFILDARAPGATVLRNLRLQLAEMKQNIIQQEVAQEPTGVSSGHKEYSLLPACPSALVPASQTAQIIPNGGQGIPKRTGFLDAVLSWLPNFASELEHFPVLEWDSFLSAVRTNVNPLAGEEHIKEVCTQLQIMGEVLFFPCESTDVIVLTPNWLCSTILGHLLSIEFLSVVRIIGCYTIEDFQSAFTECDATRLLDLLERLKLCTQCDVDGDVEYEFPCYNLVETLDGLWASDDPRYQDDACYVGLRLRTPLGTTHLLHSVFPRIQVQLRLATKRYSNPDCDLYQWLHGSKLCAKLLESIVTLVNDEFCGECIEIKVRGPSGTGMACFYFVEELLNIIQIVLNEMCPSLLVERHTLSARQLQAHSKPYCFSPSSIATAFLENGLSASLYNPWLAECCKSLDPLAKRCIACKNGFEESALDLIGCSSSELSDIVVLWPQLPVTEMSLLLRRTLCSLLDKPDPHGKDWCLLAVQLGLADCIADLDSSGQPLPTTSQTNLLLERWAQADDGATIGSLVSAFQHLGRHDASDLILRFVPFYRLMPTCEDDDENEKDDIVDVDALSEKIRTPTDGLRNNLSR